MPLSKEILKIATLGTAHHGIDVSVLGKSEHLERQLLRSIAGTKLPERAGWIPMVDEKPLPEPFPADERPICSLEILRLLTSRMQENDFMPDQVLHGLETLRRENRQILRFMPEEILEGLEFLQGLCLKTWLVEFDKMRQQVAPEFLMCLLYYASRFPEQQFQIFGFMNGYCRLILADIPFETNSFKLLKFLQFRESDPSQWVLFMEVWREQTDPSKKIRLLSMLQQKVVASDEPFIEALIDTSSADVLDMLCSLLAQLPNSHFSKVIVETVGQLIYVDSLLGREWLAVKKTLVTSLDYPNLKRYLGIQKEIYLFDSPLINRKLLSYVQPSFWCDYLEVSHEKFIKLIMSNKKRSISFWTALANASYYHQDRQFLDDICKHVYFRIDRKTRLQLTRLMSPERMQSSIVELLKYPTDLFSGSHPAIELIEECETEWSIHCADAIISVIRRNVDKFVSHAMENHTYFPDPLLLRVAFYIPLSMRNELLDLFNDVDMVWHDVHKYLKRIMEFRQELNDLIEVGTI